MYISISHAHMCIQLCIHIYIYTISFINSFLIVKIASLRSPSQLGDPNPEITIRRAPESHFWKPSLQPWLHNTRRRKTSKTFKNNELFVRAKRVGRLQCQGPQDGLPLYLSHGWPKRSSQLESQMDCQLASKFSRRRRLQTSSKWEGNEVWIVWSNKDESTFLE